MVRECLLHNMKSRCVPSVYISLINNMLSKWKTQLRFNDYISEPLEVNNGMMQGCLLSMLIYVYYNVDLIDITKGKCEMSTGFIDDCAFVAIGDTLTDTHCILKDMKIGRAHV